MTDVGDSSEPVAVIVCTRDRPADVARAVGSLLADHHQRGRIVIVDQSSGDDTATVIAGFADDRVLYVRSAVVGKGAALNEGLQHTATRFVACTDDDCEVRPGWSRAVVEPMRGDARISLVFSRVETPSYDETTGYIPAFLPTDARVLTRPRQMATGYGLGAGMAVRRDALLELGGFDPMMGPGGPFPSADDFDLELRMLLSGWRVAEEPGAVVVHHGFRTFAEGRAHTGRDWMALGASCAKPLRAGHPGVLWLTVALVWRRALWPCVQAVARRKKPPLRRVWTFGQGYLAGLRTPVDRDRLLYRPAGDPAPRT